MFFSSSSSLMEILTVPVIIGLFLFLFLFVLRIFSQEIPSDVTVHVGEASFSLHKVKKTVNFDVFKVWEVNCVVVCSSH